MADAKTGIPEALQNRAAADAAHGAALKVFRDEHNRIFTPEYRETVMSGWIGGNPFNVFAVPEDIGGRIPPGVKQSLDMFNLSGSKRQLLALSDLTPQEIKRVLAQPFRLSVTYDNYSIDTYLDYEIEIACNWNQADTEYKALLTRKSELYNRLLELKTELFDANREENRQEKELLRLCSLLETIRETEKKYMAACAAYDLMEGLFCGFDMLPWDRLRGEYGERLHALSTEYVIGVRSLVPDPIWDERDRNEGAPRRYENCLLWAAQNVEELYGKAQTLREELEITEHEIEVTERELDKRARALNITDVSGNVYRIALMVSSSTLRSKADYTRNTAVSNSKYKEVQWSSDYMSAHGKLQMQQPAEPEGYTQGQTETGRAATSQAFFRGMKERLFPEYKKIEKAYNATLFESDFNDESIKEFIIGESIPECIDVLQEAVTLILAETIKAGEKLPSMFSNWMEKSISGKVTKTVYQAGEAVKVSMQTPISIVYSGLHLYIDKQKKVFDPLNKGTYVSLEDIIKYRDTTGADTDTDETADSISDPVLTDIDDAGNVYVKVSSYDMDTMGGKMGLDVSSPWQTLDLMRLLHESKLTPQEKSACEMRLAGYSLDRIAAELEIRKYQVQRMFPKIGRRIIKENKLETKHISDIRRKAKAQKRDNKTRLVTVYDLTGVEIGVYKSASAASSALNVAANHISECLRNKRKSCKGYIFKYTEA